MRFSILGAALLLSGCALSAHELEKDEVDLTWASEKQPDIVAGCAASRLMGFTDMVRLGERHYYVARKNSFGVPIHRWDFVGTETGTRVELRSSLPVNKGSDDVRMCL